MNHRTRLFLLALLATSGPACAADFCVASANALRTALVTAASNGENDVIRIEQGQYGGGTGPIAFSYSTFENFNLVVLGGFVSLFGQACAVQVLDPEITVLSGSGIRQVLRLSGNSNTSGNLFVSNFTVRDGLSVESGAGLDIGGFAGFTGKVTVTRMIIQRNIATGIAGGLLVSADGGSADVINNLVMLNRCGGSNCAISATVNSADPLTFKALFGNNTIVFNQCAAGTNCSETGARFGGSARTVFYNNVFAGNTDGDLTLQTTGGAGVALYNNNLVSLTGTPPTAQANNLALANPQFEDILADDFRLRFTSPLRNAGTFGYNILANDLAGGLRVRESLIDIGAYENDEVLFADQFELLP